MLRLNPVNLILFIYQLHNSNTTNVKVKQEASPLKLAEERNSNTTNVKVKLIIMICPCSTINNSNTTNVKVKPS